MASNAVRKQQPRRGEYIKHFFYEVTKSSPRYFSLYSAITLHEHMGEISGTGETSSSAKKPVIERQQGHVQDVQPSVWGEGRTETLYSELHLYVEHKK